MGKKNNKQKFCSMSEVERKYFPKSSQLISAKGKTDAKNLGTLIARSSLAKVKTLTINQ